MTLNFQISNLESNPIPGLSREIILDQYAFMSINGDFEFYIEGKLVLKQASWNVGELAQQLVDWKKNGYLMDFHYNCIDAEEIDLFTFRKITGGFQFFSEWANLNVETVIDRNTIEAFIDTYAKEVINAIKVELKLDVSKYL